MTLDQYQEAAKKAVRSRDPQQVLAFLPKRSRHSHVPWKHLDDKELLQLCIMAFEGARTRRTTPNGVFHKCEEANLKQMMICLDLRAPKFEGKNVALYKRMRELAMEIDSTLMIHADYLEQLRLEHHDELQSA